MYINCFKNIFRLNRFNYSSICWFSNQRNLNPGVLNKKFLKDDEIVLERVRVLKDKKLMGDYTLFEAKLLAKNQNLNLILFNPNSDPPLCVLDNYNEFMKNQTEKENKKEPTSYSFDPSLKSKTVQISENCATSDLNRKLVSVRKFLLSGQRVDIVIATKSRKSTTTNTTTTTYNSNKDSNSSSTNKTSTNTKHGSGGQLLPSMDTVSKTSESAESKGLKVSYDQTNPLLQKIDFIYSRLSDIAKPHTMKNKLNTNSRQVVLKFWPK